MQLRYVFLYDRLNQAQFHIHLSSRLHSNRGSTWKYRRTFPEPQPKCPPPPTRTGRDRIVGYYTAAVSHIQQNVASPDASGSLVRRHITLLMSLHGPSYHCRVPTDIYKCTVKMQLYITYHSPLHTQALSFPSPRSAKYVCFIITA